MYQIHHKRDDAYLEKLGNSPDMSESGIIESMGYQEAFRHVEMTSAFL